MATYRMTARPKPSIVTLGFNTYNEAMSFAQGAAMLNPSKPYKVGLEWKVSFTRGLEKAEFEQVEDWKKPGVYFEGKLVESSYDEWKGVEGLYHLPAYVPHPQPKKGAPGAVPEPLKRSPLKQEHAYKSAFVRH